MARVTSVEEVFAAMPARFNAEAAANLNAVLQFDLSGEGGGQWHAIVADGALNVMPGQAASPTATVSATAADYLAMINGELHPMNAFMQGRVKVRGDMSLVMRMQSLFSMG